MTDSEHKDYFDSKIYFDGDEDKVIEILDDYEKNLTDLSDINRIFELYHTKLFFDKVQNIPNWSIEKYNKYKEKTKRINNVVHDYFQQINEDNVVDIFKATHYSFKDDFRYFFYLFKTYKCISNDNICRILKNLNWSPYQILENKEFVRCYDSEISDLLDDQTYGADFIISYYLEKNESKQSVYIPENFDVKRRVKLINGYLLSENINPNKLQLIINAKSSADLPITPKMKKLADKRNVEFWNNNKSASFHKCEFCVSFGHYEIEKNIRSDKEGWILEYDSDWIKNNLDYPTLLNNFIYLFEYVDSQMRCSYISTKSSESVLVDLFTVKGKGMYNKGTVFEMLDSISDIQMRGYVYELKRFKVDIEFLIKWFFEEYLCNEFGINNFLCSMPSPTDSILSKCKTLASAIDGVLNKYKMYCEDNEIDVELLKYITNSPRIKDVPSLTKNKYAYICDDNLSIEMNLLFSNQSVLRYTKKTKSKYRSFAELIAFENITLSEFQSYNQGALKWLLARNVIYLNNDIIVPNTERILILKEFYEKEVISLQHFKSKQLKKMIDNHEVSVDDKLLTKPEYQYFDYLLNNSEFSDGKAIRNRYIHDSIILDEKEMESDYYTLLKIMIILIIKINDDLCIHEEIGKEGDYYEL